MPWLCHCIIETKGGVTDLICSVHYFWYFLRIYWNIIYLSNITFIFDRCWRSICCVNTSLICMWFKWSETYFCKTKVYLWKWITNKVLSNPQPQVDLFSSIDISAVKHECICNNLKTFLQHGNELKGEINEQGIITLTQEVNLPHKWTPPKQIPVSLIGGQGYRHHTSETPVSTPPFAALQHPANTGL